MLNHNPQSGDPQPKLSAIIGSNGCLSQAFEQQVRHSPESISITCDGRSITYGQLNHRANKVAQQLVEQGVKVGDMVALALPRDENLLAGLIGILKVGAAYIPLDPEYPQSRLEMILEDCQATAIVTDASTASAIPTSACPLIRMDMLQAEPRWDDSSIEPWPLADNCSNQQGSKRTAYVIYTSGSTGKPKGVQVSHFNVLRLFTKTEHWFHFDAKDVWTLFHSYAFDFSVWEIWGALLYGGRLVVVPYTTSRSPNEVYRLLSEENVTILNQTPSAFRQLMAADERLSEELPLSLRRVIFGGEALEFSSLRGWVKRHGDNAPQLINMYGITETTVHVTYRRLMRADVEGERSSLIGQPIPDLTLHVLDEDRKPVDVGIEGEIYVGGAGVSQGYLRRPTLTAERFFPDPFYNGNGNGSGGGTLYRTGDLGRRRADGELEYLGRCDRQVQLRGFRIELGEIEARLQEQPTVGQAIAVVQTTDSGVQRLVAYLVASKDQQIDSTQLRSAVSESLPEYMVPQFFVPIDEIPLTPNGKLDAKALPEPAPPASDRPYEAPTTDTEQTIATVWCQLLKLDRVSVDHSFFELGGQSLMLAEMELRLNKVLPSSKFAIVDLFQHPTIAELATYLDSEDQKTKGSGSKAAKTNSRVQLEPIAIVGMAARVPGAESVDEFWENLKNGVESIRRLTPEELLAAGVPAAQVNDPNYVPVTSSLTDVDKFDAEFFGISPHEAKITDPQHRIFLECAWSALEHAGYDPDSDHGEIGVFAGARPNDYRALIDRALGPPDPATAFQTLISNEKDFLSTRVSFRLNLTGPSMTVQTGCSTSLVAVQLACQSLQLGQCSLALAGGVSVNLEYRNGYLSQEGMVLSPDGRVRTFDDDAQGTVFGEGVGAVVLKRLSDAKADGDTIHAVIKTVAINNDGGSKMGYSAPSTDGQCQVVQMAHEQSGITADQVGYIEAHGTGTFVGDPVEVDALTKAFRASTDDSNYCWIGSVKTNVGHQDVAAGIVGLIKAACAVRDGTIPPSLHFRTPNRNANFADSPFRVATELTEWPQRQPGQRRIAGVSAFGIGGTNAHAILEEPPSATSPEPPSTQDDDSHSNCSTPAASETGAPHLLLLSARNESALDIATRHLGEYLHQQPETSLASIERTLKHGRRAFQARRVVMGRTREELQAALADPGSHSDNIVQSINVTAARKTSVAFLFPGQGAQYVGMTRDLYDADKSFRADVDEFCQYAQPTLSVDLRQAIFEQDSTAATQLSETWLTQPAIVVIELALARLWMRQGVQPDYVVGHSIGELAAACIAGVFTPKTAIELAVLRGRLLQDLPRGKMLAVTLPESSVRERLPSGLSMAVVNSPQHCVVSGPTAAVDAFAEQLDSEEVAFRALRTSHAFHSAMMEPAMATFQAEVARRDRREPQLPIVSTVTGTWVSNGEMTQPEYWARNIRQTVNFSSAAAALVDRKTNVFIEVGPGQTLSSLVRLQPDLAGHTIRSTRHPKQESNDVDVWWKSLAEAWANGAAVDWPQNPDARPRCVPLPTYPFQRKRFWVEDAPPGTRSPAVATATTTTVDVATPALMNAEIASALPQRREPFDDWFYVPDWEPLSGNPPESTQATDVVWLVFAGEDAASQSLVKKLRSDMSGSQVTLVRAAESFHQVSEAEFTIDPNAPKHFDQLLQTMADAGRFPTRIVHLWQWNDDQSIDTSNAGWQGELQRQQSLGIYSLQFLAQSLGRFHIDTPIALSIFTHGHADSVCSTGFSRNPAATAATNSTTIPPKDGTTNSAAIHANRASLLGAAKVIPLEYPQIECRLVDIATTAWEQASDELQLAIDDVWIAYRDGQRCAPSVRRLPLDASYENTARLKQGGTYLVTGGLGGIGFSLARKLLETVNANVILLGRSPLPPRDEWKDWLDQHDADDGTSQKIQRLQQLESLPGSVVLLPADVSDEQQLRDAIATGTQQFGPIHGVVHAAGVADTAGAIQLRDKDATERMLQSKIKGSYALEAALADHPVEFWVLYSSISNVLYHNRYGQLSYVAANSFLEAFAARQRERGIHAVAIASDEWQSIGMAAEVARDFAESFGTGQRLFDPFDSFTPDQGAAMFQRVLACDASTVLISTRDLARRVELDIHAKSPFLEAARQARESDSQAVSDSAAGSNDALSGERQIARMWERLLSIPKVAADDNYFELGGDSLSAVRFLAELEKQFGQRLPFAAMVEFSTPARLAEHLGLDQATEPVAAATPATPAHRSTLVEIAVSTNKPRVFCMHAADGYALIFRELAARIEDAYSVYGLQSPALFGEPVESIEGLAKRYVNDILAVQPQGPYLLTGYCMGGTIALEVAQQLKAAGEETVLICIETYNWSTSQAASKSFWVKLLYNLQRVDYHFRNFLKLKYVDKLSFLREKWEVLKRRRKTWISRWSVASPSGDAEQTAAEIWRRHDEIAEHYQATTYDGKIILFRPQRDYLRYQDQEFPTTCETELHRLPVYPAGMMVPPFVDALTIKFTTCLDKALAKLQ